MRLFLVTKVRFRQKKPLSSDTSYSCKMWSADFTGAAFAEHLSGTQSLGSLTAEERDDFKPNNL